MSSNSLGLDKIPILSSQAQYLDWSSDVLSTAMLGGFSDALTGDNVSKTKDDEDQIRQRELKAKGLILRTVSTVLRRDLLKLTTTVEGKVLPATANEIWDHLQK